MRRREVDRVSLIAGLAIGFLAALLIADQAEVIELSFGWLGASVAGVLGIVLLVSGLRQGDG